jgi:hypothetical protein
MSVLLHVASAGADLQGSLRDAPAASQPQRHVLDRLLGHISQQFQVCAIYIYM